MVAVGRYPIVFEGEDEEEEEMGFVYTTSISWAWRVDSGSGGDRGARRGRDDDDTEELDFADIDHLSSLGTGFLGDDVIVGVGIDDVRQAVVRVKVDELLSCLTHCPGVVVEQDWSRQTTATVDSCANQKRQFKRIDCGEMTKKKDRTLVASNTQDRTGPFLPTNG